MNRCLTANPPHLPRRRVPCWLASVGLGALLASAPLLGQPRSYLQDLNQRARAAKGGADSAVRNLIDAVFDGTTIFAATPEKLRAQLFQAERAFRQSGNGSVQQDNIPDAVNQLAVGLNAPSFFAATPRQIRATRVLLLRVVPSLMMSPSVPPAGKIVGPDMSPAGAVFLGLFLLDQKLTNPEYQMDADRWVENLRKSATSVQGLGSPGSFQRVARGAVPIAALTFADAIGADLRSEGKTTAQVASFFERLGLATGAR